MTLQRSLPYLGDIGDKESEPDPNPDRVYEREMEKRMEDERNTEL